MSTFVVPLGRQLSMVQNTVYALPARQVLFFCDGSSPTIEQSTDVAFTAAKALTLASGQAEVAGGFVRCTTGNVTVYVKTI